MINPACFAVFLVANLIIPITCLLVPLLSRFKSLEIQSLRWVPNCITRQGTVLRSVVACRIKIFWVPSFDTLTKYAPLSTVSVCMAIKYRQLMMQLQKSFS